MSAVLCLPTRLGRASRRTAGALLVLVAVTLAESREAASAPPAPPVTPPAAPAAEAPSAATWAVTRDLWYRLTLAGAECGWMNLRTEDDGTHYRTVTDMEMVLERDAARVEIGTSSTWVETHDGEPVLLEMVQVTGSDPVFTSFRFEKDGVVKTIRQGGGQRSGREPLPDGEWLTPMEVERFVAARRAAGATTISYRTIDGQQGLQPVGVTDSLQGEESVVVGDRTIPVSVWHTTTSAIPVTVVSLISSDDELVRSTVPLGFGDLVTSVTTREQALNMKPGRLPEVLMANVVRPDRPIRDVMNTRRLTMRLRARQGELPALPTAGAQRTEAGDDPSEVILRIDLDAPAPASDAETIDEVYLAANGMIDIDDPFVQALAASAMQTMKDRPAAARADHLRGFVHRYVTGKGLSTAFATASEVARRREGDCSEHAVLLCALLRAEGIPARVATGLVYVDRFAGERDVFGWHMWTQALIDGSWIDLDATLPVRHHAGHVLVATSPLSDSAFDQSTSAALLLMGNVDIQIIEDTEPADTRR